MTTVSHAVLAHDTIVIGCDVKLDVVIDPIAGQSESEVSAALTGATVSAVVLSSDGTTTIATASVSIAASTRTITIALTDTVTGALAPGPYVWRVRVTTASGMVWPVRMPRAFVRVLP